MSPADPKGIVTDPSKAVASMLPKIKCVIQAERMPSVLFYDSMFKYHTFRLGRKMSN